MRPKTYTEIYDSTWKRIVLYPFVPHGQQVNGYEANIVVPLFELKVKPNISFTDTLTVEKWKQLDVAMRRAFQICNWSKEELHAYKAQHAEETLCQAQHL